MTSKLDISFARSAKATGGTAIVLKLMDGDAYSGAESVDPAGVLARAAATTKFKGKFGAKLDILAPQDSSVDRIIAIGLGKTKDIVRHDWIKAGGVASAALGNAEKVTVHLDVPGLVVTGEQAADFALGMLLRAYKFDRYKKNDDDQNGEKSGDKTVKISIVLEAAGNAKKAFETAEAVADGVVLARDLVNEPANVLGPVEFAAKAKELEKLGASVEILTEKEMGKLGMGALLGVAQGSVRPPRLVVIEWKGG